MIAICASAPARADVSQAEVVTAVTEAFKQWEDITCSKLTFEIQTVLSTLPQPIDQPNGIVVAFYGPADPWTKTNNAYFTTAKWEFDEKGNYINATIELNAGKYHWTIGKEKKALDIKTAVLHLIPQVLGFYIGSKPKTQSGEDFILFNHTDHTLLPEHEAGARFMYFDATDGSGCTSATPQPLVCGTSAPVPDAGVPPIPDGGAADAGAPIGLCIAPVPKNTPLHWETMPVKVFIYAPAGGIKPPPSGDGGVTQADGSTPTSDSGASGDSSVGKRCTKTEECGADEVCSAEGKCVSLGNSDDGCCRVAHTTEENVTATAFFLLGIALILLRRKRSE
ncbi:MAG: hypothetical protein CSA24_00935 [Deltaproteobacteria bacterium]|nr:MAG: hypothetical protein CSA24_00935 [Deltaproteobacteria bacterium]